MSRSGTRRPWRSVVLPVVLLLALVGGIGAFVTLRSKNLVVNGDAMYDVKGWDVASEAGPTTVDRLRVGDGPGGIRTVAYIRRPSTASGTWSRAVVPLDRPTSTLKAGRTYELRAWVRDELGGNPVVGLLLANGNFQHQPTASTAYTRLEGTSWHEVSMTFVSTRGVADDTGVYLALPPAGPLSWQVTGVRLAEVDLPDLPSVARQAPDRVLAFDGPAGQPADASVWTPEVGGDGWGNEELQAYVDDVRTASLDGQGRLQITAREEEATASDGITRQFASARLTTRGKVTVQPGSYVEAPITAPTGPGVWPAFWLLGQDIETKGWPTAGEIDVLEVLGSDPATARSALHMAAEGQPKRDRPFGGDSQVGATPFQAPLDTQEHRYGVYFDADVVVFYIDHRKTFVYTARDAAASGRTWPFGQPMFLLLNVAVGGQENPAGTTFPRTMTVGPVQVWNGRVPTES